MSELVDYNLKLCPFCGDFIELKKDINRKDRLYYFECKNASCGCGYYPIKSISFDEEKAVEDVNKRFSIYDQQKTSFIKTGLTVEKMIELLDEAIKHEDKT